MLVGEVLTPCPASPSVAVWGLDQVLCPSAMPSAREQSQLEIKAAASVALGANATRMRDLSAEFLVPLHPLKSQPRDLCTGRLSQLLQVQLPLAVSLCTGWLSLSLSHVWCLHPFTTLHSPRSPLCLLLLSPVCCGLCSLPLPAKGCSPPRARGRLSCAEACLLSC